MRTLVHLSDLHFGRTDPSLLDPLVRRVRSLSPDLIAVSGDLTQRARVSQFKAARAFLDSLPSPQIVVPGNHDVPLYDVFARFTQPLARFRRYITEDLEPWYRDGEIAVLGVNTARSLTFKGGRINERQIARAQQRLGGLPDGMIKVIVTHHPMHLPDDYDEEGIVGRASLAQEMLLELRCDLMLAGHLHVGVAAATAIRRGALAHEPIIVQAGTATSTRGRGESNSFGVVVTSPDRIEVRRYSWQSGIADFVMSESERFERHAAGWRKLGLTAVSPDS